MSMVLPDYRRSFVRLAACLLAAVTASRGAGAYAASAPAAAQPGWGPATESASSLYAPTLDNVVLPQFGSPQRCPTGGPAIDLYAPTTQAPGLPEQAAPRMRPRDRRSSAQPLYGPAFCSTDEEELCFLRRPWGERRRALGLYAPFGAAGCAAESSESQFAGLAERNCWDQGVVGLGLRRPSPRSVDCNDMYSVGGDSLMLLYNSDFAPEPDEPPRELSKVSLPTYRLEAPDTIRIDILQLVPRSPYRAATYDVLSINVRGTIPGRPINDYFLVNGEGQVDLGPGYGTVRVAGMTTEQATDAVTKHLRGMLRQPDVVVQLARSAGTQQVGGNYVVQPDGMVGLRGYGAVYVAGKTVTEARMAIQRHLTQYFDSPRVTVDVTGYNSKSYYVVVAGVGLGEHIERLPITGNETVLDALSQLGGLQPVSSRTMWVSRPTPGKMGCEQVLPVNFVAITQGGMTDTNYQMLPGDRLYIVDDKLVSTGRYMATVTGPIDRLFSILSTGTNSIRNVQTMGRGYNQTRRGL
jgi:polysaccharide biosynthesis/export protein